VGGDRERAIQAHFVPLGLPRPRIFIGCLVKGFTAIFVGPGSNISSSGFTPAIQRPAHHPFRICKLACPGLPVSLAGVRRIDPYVAGGAPHSRIASRADPRGSVLRERERRFTR
jgi:hypothetical protein